MSFDRRIQLVSTLLITILLLGCVADRIPDQEGVPVLMHVPQEFRTFLLDFSSYTEKGFLFTPRSYSGKYNSIGILEFKYNVEADMVIKNLNEPTEEARNAGVKTVTYYCWDIKEIDYQAILDHAYRKASLMGGNAIVNFSLEVKYEELDNAPGYPEVVIPVVNVSGFVIQRFYPYHTEPLPEEPTE